MPFDDTTQLLRVLTEEQQIAVGMIKLLKDGHMIGSWRKGNKYCMGGAYLQVRYRNTRSPRLGWWEYEPLMNKMNNFTHEHHNMSFMSYNDMHTTEEVISLISIVAGL